MQDFHYNYIKNKYCDKDEMLLTSPDSFIYKIEAKLKLMFLKDKDLFDFINYPKD